ncbi:MAG: sigma-70 family RNA polymerase sigma factor [Anaerolineae bacterium]|nr:sigma-70 family RNA polymerase sigma factor [Anaerolineae bacterium]
MELAALQTASPHTITEIDLVTFAKQGDTQAYGELVRRHHNAIINIVYRMCGDSTLAEDAAQEAFIRAWQHLHTYQPKAAFRTWLCRIALNAAKNLLRQEKPVADVDNFDFRDVKASPEQSYVNNEKALSVQKAVIGLPEASRAALILREYEGFSYQEIAETLDIPIGTVMSRLNYARKSLRQTLAAYMEAG